MMKEMDGTFYAGSPSVSRHGVDGDTVPGALFATQGGGYEWNIAPRNKDTLGSHSEGSSTAGESQELEEAGVRSIRRLWGREEAGNEELSASRRRIRNDFLVDLGIVLTFIAAVVIFFVVVVLRRNTPTSAAPEDPTTPTNFTRAELIEFVQQQSPTTDFHDPDSPQGEAVTWMVADSYSQSLNFENEPEAYVFELIERFSLVTFWFKTNGEAWNTTNNDWLKPVAVCEWDNLACDDEGRVSKIHIRKGGLGGSLCPQLGHLTHLTHLDLATNDMTGEIPSSLLVLTNLVTLNLSGNDFRGRLSSDLSQFSLLNELVLGDNTFTGTIPAAITELTTLKVLHLGGNQLTGEILSGIGQMTHLSTLDLSVNMLEGEIPDSISTLTSLESLAVFQNLLSGEIPSKIGMLADLTKINLSSNGLIGTIPVEIGDLTKLDLLELSQNSLSGPIPSELGMLSNLKTLTMQDNELTGAFPDEAMVALGKLDDFYMHKNGITGSIPLGLCAHVAPRIDCQDLECDCCVDESETGCDSGSR